MLTTITRQRKYEAEQAIEDLLKRGFQVKVPLTEISREGKVFSTDTRCRKIFQRNTFSSCWKAVLEKVDKP